MKLELSFSNGDNNRKYALSTQDSGLFGAHLMDDIGSSCQWALARIEEVGNGTKTGIGGNAACANITVEEVLIVPVWDWKPGDGPEDYPIVSMSLDEYRRIICLWEKFLEFGEEKNIDVICSDEVISPDEVITRFKSAF